MLVGAFDADARISFCGDKNADLEELRACVKMKAVMEDRVHTFTSVLT